MSNASVPDSLLDLHIRSKIFDAAEGGSMPAIDDLAFSLEANTFNCIIGPSGCGKTTTLKILLGLDKQYDGEIRFSRSRNMTAVFQEPRLLPWRTVEQNVTLALADDQPAALLDTLFSELDIADVRQFYPSELSLGMARRVALARAFAVIPDLLILDEPFVSLDDVTAQRLRTLLLGLWRRSSCTALMVTHNISEAAALADKIIVLSARPAQKRDEIMLDVPQEERDSVYIKAISDKVRQAGLVA